MRMRAIDQCAAWSKPVGRSRQIVRVPTMHQQRQSRCRDKGRADDYPVGIHTADRLICSSSIHKSLAAPSPSSRSKAARCDGWRRRNASSRAS